MTQSTPYWGTGMHSPTSKLTLGEWMSGCGSEGSVRGHVSDTPVLGCWHASGGTQTFINPVSGDVAALSVGMKSGGGGAKSGGVELVVVRVGLGGRNEGCVRGDLWKPPVNGNSRMPYAPLASASVELTCLAERKEVGSTQLKGGGVEQ